MKPKLNVTVIRHRPDGTEIKPLLTWSRATWTAWMAVVFTSIWLFFSKMIEAAGV